MKHDEQRVCNWCDKKPTMIADFHNKNDVVEIASCDEHTRLAFAKQDLEYKKADKYGIPIYRGHYQSNQPRIDMKKKKYKLKKWWWYFIKPKGFRTDELMFNLSASNDINKGMTKKLATEFLEKYYKLK